MSTSMDCITRGLWCLWRCSAEVGLGVCINAQSSLLAEFSFRAYRLIAMFIVYELNPWFVVCIHTFPCRLNKSDEKDSSKSTAVKKKSENKSESAEDIGLGNK